MEKGLKERIVPQSDLTELSEKLKEEGKKIVFTAGAWDMLHVGQARYLKEARSHGDVLVVGTSSNIAIRKVKGPERPILDEKVRAEMLLHLKCVDFVTILPEPSCQPTLALLKPDVYITVKEDWNVHYKDSKEYKTVTKNGGKIVVVDRQSPYISTTKIMERVVSCHLGGVFKDYMQIRKKPLKEK
ncbi:adenylyltransferase/cytidyltransferase family protein [Candidatus Dojkabacteria bacterium]|nr:adenylyltransferase/cytidyltransferase family protein [Candidatus Dojkabacteria bacterium]